MTTIKEILEEKKLRSDFKGFLIDNKITLEILSEEDEKKIADFWLATYSHLIEEIIKMVGETKIEKAHTYSSENSDVYIAFDKGQADMKNRIITNLSTLNE